jgi:hypothetical protein
MEAILIDAETCDLVLQSEGGSQGVAGMALEGEGKQEEFAEPRTPNRTEQGEGMVVDEELLS